MTTDITSPIEALRKAAKDSKIFDEERASADIETAIGSYRAAARYSVFHEDQMRPREAIKALEPILGHLRQLGERLDAMNDEHWRDWLWIAAGAYGELPDVREDLDRWNTERAEKIAGTGADLSDHVVSEVDQVNRDLGDLTRIVAKVEPRLRAVADAMRATQRKDGRPPQVARTSLFRKLRAIYEHHTGQKATAKAEKSDLGAYGQFVDFVVAVTKEMRFFLPYAGLGTAVRNSLYPTKTKGRKRV